jgi:hypothetical protein
MESGEELIDCAVCDEDEQEAEEQRPPEKPRTAGLWANAPTVYDVDEVEDTEQRLLEGWTVPVDGERRAGSGSGSVHGSGPLKRKARSDTAIVATSVTRTRKRNVCAEPGCATFAQRQSVGSKCTKHGFKSRCDVPGCAKHAHRGSRCVAHGGGLRCDVPDCGNSAAGGTLADGSHRCKAHSVEAVARREEKARAQELFASILAAPSAGPLPLLRFLVGEAWLPRCELRVGRLYVRAFRCARGRSAPDDATGGAEASASSDSVDALEDDEADDTAPQLVDAASEDDEAVEMEEVAQLGTTSDEARER